VDALGRTIGINTVIFTAGNRTNTWIGIGFAIPINRARRVADELIKYGRRRHPWTGITAQALTRQVALALGYERTDGVVVTGVQRDSPGAVAGLKTGDIITRIGGTRIRGAADLEEAFVNLFVNDRVTVTYHRKREEHTTHMTLVEYPRGG
jgi:serine protease Do